MAAVVLAGVSQALLGYAQFLFQLGPAAFGAHRPLFRSYGTFDQPNPYAGFLNMTLPMAIATAALAWRPLYRRVALGCTLLIAAALLSSQSGARCSRAGRHRLVSVCSRYAGAVQLVR